MIKNHPTFGGNNDALVIPSQIFTYRRQLNMPCGAGILASIMLSHCNWEKGTHEVWCSTRTLRAESGLDGQTFCDSLAWLRRTGDKYGEREGPAYIIADDKHSSGTIVYDLKPLFDALNAAAATPAAEKAPKVKAARPKKAKAPKSDTPKATLDPEPTPTPARVDNPEYDELPVSFVAPQVPTSSGASIVDRELERITTCCDVDGLEWTEVVGSAAHKAAAAARLAELAPLIERRAKILGVRADSPGAPWGEIDRALLELTEKNLDLAMYLLREWKKEQLAA